MGLIPLDVHCMPFNQNVIHKVLGVASGDGTLGVEEEFLRFLYRTDINVGAVGYL